MFSQNPAANESSHLLNLQQAETQAPDLMEEIPPELPLPWYRRAGRSVASLYQTAKSAARTYLWTPTYQFVRQHPIILFLGPLSAGTNGINATIAISGYDSKELLTGLWWRSMDNGKKVMSVLSGLSSLSVNTALFWGFALALKQRLNNLKQEFLASSKSRKVKFAIRSAIIASMLLGVGAALSAFAIGTDAWLWATLATGLIIGGFNGINTFLSRIFGILNVMHRVKDAHSDHVKTQKAYANQLRLIHPDWHVRLNARIRNKVELILYNERLKDLTNQRHDSEEWKNLVSTPLTLQQYRKLSILINNDLVKLQNKHQNLILEKQLSHYLSEYGGFIFDLAMASTFALTGYLFFSQKGIDGAKIIANAVTNVRLENTTSVGHQAAMGVIPGLATFISYGEAGFVFRPMMLYLFRSLNKHPATILPVILLMFAIGLSSLGNATIAKGVINNQDNYLGLEPYEALSQVLNILFIIGGAIANARMVSRVTPEYDPVDIDLQSIIDRNQEAPDDFTDEQLIPDLLPEDDLGAHGYPLNHLGARAKASMKGVSQLGHFGARAVENNAYVQPADRSTFDAGSRAGMN